MKLHDDVHNYYEHLVLDKIVELGLNKTRSSDYLADLCCLALNQVPPKYIRYEVDMAFFLGNHERSKMEKEVAVALKQAIEILDTRENSASV